ncbi:MAG: hypothetical protein Pars2KO_24510 [Parasphingorhabdus sp.]
MSFPVEDLPDIPPGMIADVKNFVRLEQDSDNAAIDEFIRSAAALCEDFVGQMLIARPVTDLLAARGEWQKLKQLPVQTISEVAVISAAGTAVILPPDSYALDIDSDGYGWVRIESTPEASRIRVAYSAGLGANWDDLPQTLRQGIVRLAGYLYTNRDGVDVGGPPSAVTALWRPHRRMRLA